MPQPLSSVAPKSGVRFGPASTWDRPSLLKYIGHTISLVSAADYHWAAILASTGKSDPRAIMAMHGALSSTAAQRAVFKALVALKLPKDQQDLIELVDKESKAARGIRNDFCHHLWGSADDLEDALLLIDPTAYHKMQIGFLERLQGMDTDKEEDMDRSLMMVYREADLHGTAILAGETLDATIKLRLVFEPGRNLPPVEQRHQALLDTPLISRALLRREQQKPSQQLPPQQTTGE